MSGFDPFITKIGQFTN